MYFAALSRQASVARYPLVMLSAAKQRKGKTMTENMNQWDEETSATFIDYGRYMVPERERQMAIMVALLPARAPLTVLELCCGEGLLADEILRARPEAIVHGYDGSARMLAAAAERAAWAGGRFRPQEFDLGSPAWRQPDFQPDAVVSSLAIHHLDGPGKAVLYRDLFQLMAPGGQLLIADLIEAPSAAAQALAAAQWDEAVKARSLAFDGHTDVYDFFDREGWNILRHPDPMDMPSPIHDHLRWLADAGFEAIDVYWLKAGHAIYGGQKPA